MRVSVFSVVKMFLLLHLAMQEKKKDKQMGRSVLMPSLFIKYEAIVKHRAIVFLFFFLLMEILPLSEPEQSSKKCLQLLLSCCLYKQVFVMWIMCSLISKRDVRHSQKLGTFVHIP